MALTGPEISNRQDEGTSLRSRIGSQVLAFGAGCAAGFAIGIATGGLLDGKAVEIKTSDEGTEIYIEEFVPGDPAFR